MKKSFCIILLTAAVCFPLHLSAQKDKQAEKARNEQAVKKAIDERHFRIDVNYMTPTRGRSRALTDSYSLEVRNDSLFSYLPYTGEAYSIPYEGGKALNFNAPIQTYETKEKKRGRKEVKITTSNEEDSYTYSVTISSNGSAYIHVQPIRRQPISFSGQIELEE